MSSTENESGKTLVIAIPVAGGRLCTHFGHSQWFALLEVDTAKREILNSRQLDPPAHQPGVLPRWLHNHGVNLVIAGGMGRRAQGIFAEQGIQVVVGAPPESPEEIARSYLEGNLGLGENICDH
jgi:ATP-binding protein involved in chromosome partitioning